jgi:transcriptional regulator with XRE-family HTH domain
MAPRSTHSAPLLATTVKAARESASLSVRELARAAGISHSQIVRLEAGDVSKPSRQALVAIAKALNRNPNSLLILAGHLDEEQARGTLKVMFRPGSELAEIWADADGHGSLRAVRAMIGGSADEAALRTIAASAFEVAESDETLWDDSYLLAAASGENADQLRELLDIWRYVPSDLRRRWLEYGRALQRVADLEYLAEAERDRHDSAHREGSRA